LIFVPKEVWRLWEECRRYEPIHRKRHPFPRLEYGQRSFREKTNKLENDIEISFVNKITSQFPDNIAKVIFFGSRAKGIPKPDSDYDFLVILRKKDRLTSEGIYEVVTDFLLEYGVDISLKIYSLEEFQKMISIPTPFMASILKTGRELWIPKSSR
jgi:predicted nucleotidyltransferase